jgi:hypothetical protein
MPSVVSHDSDTPTLAILMRICLLVADEIECGGKGIGGSGQESDNDIGGKHGELQ